MYIAWHIFLSVWPAVVLMYLFAHALKSIHGGQSIWRSLPASRPHKLSTFASSLAVVPCRALLCDVLRTFTLTLLLCMFIPRIDRDARNKRTPERRLEVETRVWFPTLLTTNDEQNEWFWTSCFVLFFGGKFSQDQWNFFLCKISLHFPMVVLLEFLWTTPTPSVGSDEPFETWMAGWSGGSFLEMIWYHSWLSSAKCSRGNHEYCVVEVGRFDYDITLPLCKLSSLLSFCCLNRLQCSPQIHSMPALKSKV